MNPALRKLGFGPRDRVAIVHVDDVGMCHATVPAFFDLAAEGRVTSGSAMVPCPWFPEAADWARRTPEIDLGVHLTLTSEWERYRWGPLTSANGGSGFVDGTGRFVRSPQSFDRPDPAAALAEMRAQALRAREAGVDVTHLDCHMFAMLAPGLADPYVSLGFELGLPVLLTRQRQWVEILSKQALDRWEEQGMPVVDHLREVPQDATPETVRAIFEELPPGLAYVILHPALDTPELRAVAEDWRCRVAEYEIFRSLSVTEVQMAGWRAFRPLVQGG